MSVLTYTVNMQEFQNRIDLVEQGRNQLSTWVARRDMGKLLGNCETLLKKLSQESVNCRRFHKETLRYKELAAELDTLLSHCEQHLTFAALLSS